MKEIIEKYKSGALTTEEFYRAGYSFEDGDDYRMSSRPMINVVYVTKSAQLDKEIEEMEKQPTEYEYVKVEFEKLSDLVLLYEVGDELCLQHAHDDTKPPVNLYGAISAFRHKDQLYRRVGLTPKQLRERKVEELVKLIDKASDEYWLGDVTDGDKGEDVAIANAFLEWMESKGK